MKVNPPIPFEGGTDLLYNCLLGHCLSASVLPKRVRFFGLAAAPFVWNNEIYMRKARASHITLVNDSGRNLNQQLISVSLANGSLANGSANLRSWAQVCSRCQEICCP
jgi:hypothetical protein